MRAGYSLFSWDGLVFPDEDRFWIEANNLVESGTLIWKDEYAHDMPVTALLIAFFLKVTGSGVLGVRLLFSAISAMTIYLISRMAGILSENPRVPVVAAAVSAFYPFFYLLFIVDSVRDDFSFRGDCLFPFSFEKRKR